MSSGAATTTPRQKNSIAACATIPSKNSWCNIRSPNPVSLFIAAANVFAAPVVDALAGSADCGLAEANAAASDNVGEGLTTEDEESEIGIEAHEICWSKPKLVNKSLYS